MIFSETAVFIRKGGVNRGSRFSFSGGPYYKVFFQCEEDGKAKERIKKESWRRLVSASVNFKSQPETMRRDLMKSVYVSMWSGLFWRITFSKTGRIVTGWNRVGWRYHAFASFKTSRRSICIFKLMIIKSSWNKGRGTVGDQRGH